MKKNKLAAVIAFLVILFIVFVFGLFIGKKFSSKSSKEGTIKESVFKNKNKFSSGKNRKEQTPISANNIKFAPISKLPALKKENDSKKLESKKEVKVKSNPISEPTKYSPEPKPQPKVETKIVYVKKPVYVYKYVTKPAPVNKSGTSPFNSKVYYTIQVAALKNYMQAKTLANKLNSMGFFAYIVPISVSGKSAKAVYQQVRVGKFSTINGAKSIKNIISKKFNVKPYIIKVD